MKQNRLPKKDRNLPPKAKGKTGYALISEAGAISTVALTGFNSVAWKQHFSWRF